MLEAVPLLVPVLLPVGLDVVSDLSRVNGVSEVLAARDAGLLEGPAETSSCSVWSTLKGGGKKRDRDGVNSWR